MFGDDDDDADFEESARKYQEKITHGGEGNIRHDIYQDPWSANCPRGSAVI